MIKLIICSRKVKSFTFSPVRAEFRKTSSRKNCQKSFPDSQRSVDDREAGKQHADPNQAGRDKVNDDDDNSFSSYILG